MQRSTSGTGFREPSYLGRQAEAESAAREVRLLKPMAPVRSYTVILLGLLVFTVALIIFLLGQSPK